MKKAIKKGATVVLLSSLMIQGGLPVFAADTATAVVSVPSSNFGLTQDIRAAVKSVSVETTAQGLQLSAVVRLYNGGTVQNRVPEHELRMHTTDGIEYTLKPSAANKTSLQPKEVSELVYMVVIDSKDQMKIDQLSFVDVDMYTYPKKETYLLNMPVSSQVWYKTGGSFGVQADTLAWGQAFTLPGVNSDITYTPVSISEQTSSANGPVKVVTVLAENPGFGRETIPSFRIDAIGDQKLYNGVVSASDAKALEPGEKQYLHFAIPVETGVAVEQLLVSTTDNFVPSAPAGTTATPTVVASGKLTVAVPEGSQTDALPATTYLIGTPIAFDPLTKVIDSKTQVSMVELHLHENPESGYKTAVAKFRLTNTSDSPVPMADFQTQLTAANGVSYSGTRQTSVSPVLDPGLSYVVSYSFNLPQSETGESLTMKILDAKAAAPYTTTIAALQTAAQKNEEGDTFSLYPYDIKLNNYDISYTTMSGNPITYTYKIKVDLDIKQKENVVVDNNFSKLRFEIVDPAGRIVGTADAAFTGAKKLISGEQTIDATNIKSDEFSFPITVNMYEVITTPNGEAKRLVKTFQQG